MVIRGFVKGGVVIPESGESLPEGAQVVISPLSPETSPSPRTLAQGIHDFIGIGDDMPTDGSRNVEHYLYGAPKR